MRLELATKKALERAEEYLASGTMGKSFSGGFVAAMLAEARRLEAAVIDGRAQYLLWLHDNPDCTAWNFDELDYSDQAALRSQAMKNLEMEEPWMLIQLREAREEAAKWRQIAIEERVGRAEDGGWHLTKEEAARELERDTPPPPLPEIDSAGRRCSNPSIAARELSVEVKTKPVPRVDIRECARYLRNNFHKDDCIEKVMDEWSNWYPDICRNIDAVQMTPERREAIERAIGGLTDHNYHNSSYALKCAEILRSMLEGAKGE